jgi:hypothetical protein
MMEFVEEKGMCMDFIITLLNLRTQEACYAKISRRTMGFI